MFAHEPHNERPIGVRNPQSTEDPIGDRGTDLRVIGGAGDLADVVQQRGQQQEVGALDIAHQPAGHDDRLDRVSVDGMPVDRVVLRPATDLAPFRDPLLDNAGQVQALPDPDQARTGSEQVGEESQRVSRPGLRQRRAARREVRQGGRGQ